MAGTADSPGTAPEAVGEVPVYRKDRIFEGLRNGFLGYFFLSLTLPKIRRPGRFRRRQRVFSGNGACLLISSALLKTDIFTFMAEGMGGRTRGIPLQSRKRTLYHDDFCSFAAVGINTVSNLKSRIMKKAFLFLAGLAFMGFSSSYSYAQFKPEGNSFSVEMNYSPGGFSTDGAFTLSQLGAKGRYFINKNMVVRLNLGISTHTDKQTNFYTVDATDYQQIVKNNTTIFSITPGFEYHFAKFERISPYVGAEIGFLTQAVHNKQYNTQNSNKVDVKAKSFGFGVAAVTGVDVYLCKGLYLGVELSLGYSYVKNGGATTTTVDGQTTVTNEVKDFTSDNIFGFMATPALRIGWHF